MVNPDGNFLSVYGLYHHEQFGYLIGAYVVEVNSDGKFTLKYQRLLPENFDAFSHGLDEADRKLTHLLYEISLNGLYKQFGARESSFQQFVDKFAGSTYKQIILDYIERRKAEAIAMLAGKNFYLKSKDGYPAWKKLSVLNKKAGIKFYVKRTKSDTLYTAKLVLNDKEENINAEISGVLVSSPPWILWNQLVIPLEEDIDGKKIVPFTKKQNILIPRHQENEFYTKFLLRLLELYEVDMQGFDVARTATPPHIQLVVTKDNADIYTFRLAAKYGDLRLWIRKPFKRVHVQLEYGESAPKLFVVERNPEIELRVSEFFAKLRKDESQLFDFGLNAEKALAWMEENYAALTSKGIELVQEYEGEKFNFERPMLSAEAEKNESGYLIKSGISIGKSWIPLTRIKKNVLNFDRKYVVNKDNAVLLPKTWLENLRLLFEIADEDESGNLFVQRCHAGVIRSAFRDVKVRGFVLSEAFEEIKSVAPPMNFKAELREYQKAGYDWLCFLREFGVNGILADDMGLGKTVQTLALLQKVKEEGSDYPHLIVAPNSLVFNWTAEIKRFAPELKVLEHTGPKRDKTLKNRSKFDVVITTYGIVRQDEEYLSQCQFEYVVLDECQYIKNGDAKITQAIFKLKSKSRLALTGTPIENSTMDLWTQINFLNPGMLGTSYFFERYYANPIEKQQSVQRRDELSSAVYPIILRRTKEMVAKDLPERIVDCIYSEMTDDQKKLYKETTALYRTTLFGDNADFQKNKMQILAGLQRLRQIAIHPQMIDPMKKESGKYNAIKEMLFQLHLSGEKVIVFSQFVKFLTILKYDLVKEKIKFSYLDGSTKDRESAVNHFQRDSETNVFLISMKAGGVGLNLTAARYVMLVDPWWNPAVEMQAISRAHRIGQNHSVFVYKFISKESIEEKIVKLQEYKSKLAEEVIKSESGFFKALDKDDLIDLFD